MFQVFAIRFGLIRTVLHAQTLTKWLAVFSVEAQQSTPDFGGRYARCFPDQEISLIRVQPNPKDWDVNFPAGWKSADMKSATGRVFSRIPGTDHPSLDGKLYNQQGYDVITSGLAKAGWKNLTHVNDYPDQKNRTFGQTEYMFSNGERGGPLATYLVTSKARPNFKLWMNTTVKRVIRSGGHVTGVEVEPYGDNGYKGIVQLTPVTGRVILSAGTFGSAKILMRSMSQI